MASLQEMIAKAKERANLRIETWIPKEEGDMNGGVLESTQFMSFPFDNKHREDGLTASTVIRMEDGDCFRYNWMGTVPESTWERVQPLPGDIIWIEHQGLRENKDPNLKDYELINIAVLDPATGQEPVGRTVSPEVAVNLETGEVQREDDEESFWAPDDASNDE